MDGDGGGGGGGGGAAAAAAAGEPEAVDYYAVLNVAKDATARDIRSAYMRLSPHLHPDRQPPARAAAATEAFRRLHRAYDVLSDPTRRWVFDQYGELGLEVLADLTVVVPLLSTDAFRRTFAETMRVVGGDDADEGEGGGGRRGGGGGGDAGGGGGGGGESNDDGGPDGSWVPSSVSVKPTARAAFLLAGSQQPGLDASEAISIGYGASGSLHGIGLLPAPRPRATLHASAKHSWVRRTGAFGSSYKEPQGASLSADVVQPLSHLTVARVGGGVETEGDGDGSRFSAHAAVSRRVAANHPTVFTFKVRFVPSVLVRARGLAALGGARPSLRVGHDLGPNTRLRGAVSLGPRGATLSAGATRRLGPHTLVEASVAALPGAGAGAELTLAGQHRFSPSGNPLLPYDLVAAPSATLHTATGTVSVGGLVRQPRVPSRHVACFVKWNAAARVLPPAGAAADDAAAGAAAEDAAAGAADDAPASPLDLFQVATGFNVRLGRQSLAGGSGWHTHLQVALATGLAGASSLTVGLTVAGASFEVPVYFFPRRVPLLGRLLAGLLCLPLANLAGRALARRAQARFLRDECSDAGRSLILRREAALAQQEVMRRRARASRAAQQRDGGLVILYAAYYSPALAAQGAMLVGGRFYPAVDATVPLQYMVRGEGAEAALSVPAGQSKADAVPGLYFPSPCDASADSAVELAVIYAFGGERYRAVVSDTQALELPGAGHPCPWGEDPLVVSTSEPEIIGPVFDGGGGGGGGDEDGDDDGGRATAATDLEAEVMDDDDDVDDDDDDDAGDDAGDGGAAGGLDDDGEEDDLYFPGVHEGTFAQVWAATEAAAPEGGDDDDGGYF